VNVAIIGLGYVGLPLAQEAVQADMHVTGLDIKETTVEGLNAGRSHVDDPSDAEIAAVLAVGLRATTDPRDCVDPDACEHRLGQRDGDVLPRARHRSMGRDTVYRHEAVRLSGFLPGSGGRRPLHSYRPEHLSYKSKAELKDPSGSPS
jgi:nucleoside-diphosphate-sugar epimerase